jgi:hypothetical protein
MLAWFLADVVEVHSMRRRSLFSLGVVIGVTVVPCFLEAQELLTNGGFELVPPDLGGPYTSPPGWTLTEGPLVPSIPASDPTLGGNNPYLGDYNNSGVQTLPCPGILCNAVDAGDYVLWRKQVGGPGTLANRHPNFVGQPNVFPAEYNIWRTRFGYPYVMDLAQPSNFSHLLFEGDWQVWFEPYNGTEAAAEDNFAHLTQLVQGTPGLQYTFTGWALFEDYFPGGVDNLNAAPGGVPSGAPFNDGPPSPTDSFFGLDFLDASGNVLAGSVEKELKADGQPSNTTWVQHTLVGIAPAGTVSVRVRATMLDGVYNPLPSPQVFQMSFFVDAFSLTATTPGAGSASGIPEPSTALLSTLATVGSISTLRFRSNTRRRRGGVDCE